MFRSLWPVGVVILPDRRICVDEAGVFGVAGWRGSTAVGDLQKLKFSAPLSTGFIDDDGVGCPHLASRCGADVVVCAAAG